jgi:two-component sensor histidine kinase
LRPRADDLDKEANHRIANNLSVIAGLVRLHASDAAARPDRQFSGAEVRDLLSEIGSRIDTVGKLHRLLSGSPTGEPLDLADYIADTAQTLVSSMANGDRVSLSCRGARGCKLDPDQAAPIALIVSELITNALKHAHPANAPGKIAVRCGAGLGHAVFVEVEDDGVGLPEDFDPQTDGGLGFQVIRGLARQLDARLIFDTEALGLRVGVIVPALELEPDAA